MNVDATEKRTTILGRPQLESLRSVASMGGASPYYRGSPLCDPADTLSSGSSSEKLNASVMCGMDAAGRLTIQRFASLRNSVVAVLLASSAQIVAGETETAIELPPYRQTVQDGQVPGQHEETEQFLEPLAYEWSLDAYIASRAVEAFYAGLYADH